MQTPIISVTVPLTSLSSCILKRILRAPQKETAALRQDSVRLANGNLDLKSQIVTLRNNIRSKLYI